MEKTYLTTVETMEYLSISRNTLKKMIAEGVLPKPVNLGSRLVRFSRVDIDNYIQQKRDNDSGIESYEETAHPS